MLTLAQKELLESYFSEDGLYHEAIMESAIHPTILINYLDQALDQAQVEVFNEKLDVLYRHIYIHDLRSTFELALLKTLKLVNDLMFNHSVRLQTDSCDKEPLAREFHLERISPIDTSDEKLASELKTLLTAYVSKIQAKLRPKVTLAHDIPSELPAHGSIYWRRELSLPKNQQLSYSPTLELLIKNQRLSEYDLVNTGTQWAERVAAWVAHPEVRPLWDAKLSILGILKSSTDQQIRMVLDICKESAIRTQLVEQKITFEGIFRLGMARIHEAERLAARSTEPLKKTVTFACSSPEASLRNSTADILSLPQITASRPSYCSH